VKSFIRIALFLPLTLSLAACGSIGSPAGDGDSTIEIDGTIFQIQDAAVYSNCLSTTFAIRAFVPPPGMNPQAFFPPGKTIEVRIITPSGELDGHPLGGGGGGGGGGDEEDGRVWMQQSLLYSLEGSLPEGEQVTLELTIALDDDFGRTEPLEFHIPLTAGPGGGTCD
jgi:hypothetical protein